MLVPLRRRSAASAGGRATATGSKCEPRHGHVIPDGSRAPRARPGPPTSAHVKT